MLMNLQVLYHIYPKTQRAIFWWVLRWNYLGTSNLAQRPAMQYSTPRVLYVCEPIPVYIKNWLRLELPTSIKTINYIYYFLSEPAALCPKSCWPSSSRWHQFSQRWSVRFVTVDASVTASEAQATWLS